jgi:predicted nucleotidyltransferase
VKTIDATSAKNRFGELIEACRAGPVAVKRHGRVVAYVVAPHEFGAGGLETQLAAALRAAGARYATLFGSLAHGTASAESDADVSVSLGRPMTTAQRVALIGAIADIAGRPVDLIDLETARGLVFARAMQGRELVCDAPDTRQRLIARLLRTEDDRRVSAIAARSARAGLFR